MIQSDILKSPIIIAGPCSAESEEQVLATSHALSKIGVGIFRAGVWKPRTKPGGFEGMGEQALEWLRKVKQETGMLTATEVATAHHVEAALAAGIDLLWIGARTATNPFAVQEIADTLKSIDKDVPVLVKNPVNPDLDLWIGALERLGNAGVRQLGAIHRGFSAYGQHYYRNPPQWYIPIELKRRFPKLPLICDPSHIGGRRELVSEIAREALDLDFDGLIIESHCNPDAALSDNQQQLTPEEFKHLFEHLRFKSQKLPDETLLQLRHQIDSIDAELIEVLSRRMAVSREIGQYKKEHDMPVFQVDRHDDIMRSRLKTAALSRLDEKFMRRLLSAIHEESVRQQLDIINGRQS